MDQTSLHNADPALERHRFDLIDQEQLAAQLIAVMEAHLQRPTADEKKCVLRLAERQITDGEVYSLVHELSCG